MDNHQNEMKEVYALLEDLLDKQLFNEVVNYFNEMYNKELSLDIYISMLTVTQDYKECISNRNKIFNKAEKLAIDQIGKEKLDKSIFYKLNN